MPDTLPHPWTWTNLPEWERGVLQGVKDILKESGRYDCGLLFPNERWEQRFWYGVEVWVKGYWRKPHLGNVFCQDLVLYFESSGPPIKLDLQDPQSLPQLVAILDALVAQSDRATVS